MKKRIHPQDSSFDKGLLLEGFKVYEIGEYSKDVPDYVRRDFYKICITDGQFIISYNNQVTVTSDAILFFGSPHRPYTCQTLAAGFSGYACVFTQRFLNKNDSLLNAEDCSLFQKGNSPIISLSKDQNDCIRDIFRKMIAEVKGDYKYKNELIRSQIKNLMHFAEMEAN
ncbi:hypothetical protein D3C85_401720 [compost metagenome]